MLLGDKLHVFCFGKLSKFFTGVSHALFVLLASSFHLLLLLHLVHLQTSNSLDLLFRELRQVLLRQVLELLGSQTNLSKDLFSIKVFIVINHVVLSSRLCFLGVHHLVGDHLLIHSFSFLFAYILVWTLADHLLFLRVLLYLLMVYLNFIFVFFIFFAGPAIHVCRDRHGLF